MVWQLKTALIESRVDIILSWIRRECLFPTQRFKRGYVMEYLNPQWAVQNRLDKRISLTWRSAAKIHAEEGT